MNEIQAIRKNNQRRQHVELRKAVADYNRTKNEFHRKFVFCKEKGEYVPREDYENG